MKQRFNGRLRLLVIGLLVTFRAGPGFAQTSRGTVSGTVVDSSDALVRGATVTLTNTATRVARSTETNQAGLYRFDAVDPGVYNLEIAKAGFKAYLSTAFGVEANRTATLDAKLELGGSRTIIQVNADSAELLVKDAPLRGGNFQPHEVIRLPLATLEPIALARTLPGVILPSGSKTFGRGGEATQFSVNGQRPRANNYLLDGTDNNDIFFTGLGQSLNITDAVQEVSAQTSNFGVEFGAPAAACLM